MAIKIKGIDKWVLPAYLPQLRNYHTRINVFYGGAGSGKSHFVVQKMIIKALRMKRKMLIIRKVGATIKSSIWDLFMAVLSAMPQTVLAANKSEMTITLINGSVLLFKGLDDPEKIKSIQGITDIVIEEATELTLDDFTQLNLRLRSKEPFNQIHLMFNPVSKANWVYEYFFAHGTPDDTMILHTLYTDNKYLPEEYIKSLKDLEMRNPAYYKIYVLGEFATLDKLVFPIKTVRLINPDETEGLLYWSGMDFGYTNDPTAINWGYVDNANKRLFIVGEYDKKGMTNDVIARTLQSLGLSKEVIIADSAEPKSIAEIRRAGIKRIKPAAKGKDSIKNGIDRIQRYEIIIDERCTKTIEEFDNYTWVKDKKTNEYINEPIDTFNHHIDAIRYGTQDVMKKKARTGCATSEKHFLI